MSGAHAATVGFGSDRRTGGHVVAVRCRRCHIVVMRCRRWRAFVEVVGRIATVVVVVAVGVVHRVHRGRCAVCAVVARRRHGRTEAVIVVAVAARAIVVAHSRRYADDHPVLVARPVPEEGQRLEVFEGGEAEELVVHLVVGHDGEGNPFVEAVSRNFKGNSLDFARVHLHVFVGVGAAIVGVEIE